MKPASQTHHICLLYFIDWVSNLGLWPWLPSSHCPDHFLQYPWSQLSVMFLLESGIFCRAEAWFLLLTLFTMRLQLASFLPSYPLGKIILSSSLMKWAVNGTDVDHLLDKTFNCCSKTQAGSPLLSDRVAGNIWDGDRPICLCSWVTPKSWALCWYAGTYSRSYWLRNFYGRQTDRLSQVKKNPLCSRSWFSYISQHSFLSQYCVCSDILLTVSNWIAASPCWVHFPQLTWDPESHFFLLMAQRCYPVWWKLFWHTFTIAMTIVIIMISRSFLIAPDFA